MTSNPHVALALQILQALLTPVIAGIAVYVAWQQWQGNKLKLVLDRYDRRMRVYGNVVAFLRLVMKDFKPEISDLLKFPFDTAEADFLFGPEIPEYLNELFHRAWKLRDSKDAYRDMFRSAPPEYDHGKVVTDIHAEQVWFMAQREAAKQKFKKYLDVSR